MQKCIFINACHKTPCDVGMGYIAKFSYFPLRKRSWSLASPVTWVRPEKFWPKKVIANRRENNITKVEVDGQIVMLKSTIKYFRCLSDDDQRHYGICKNIAKCRWAEIKKDNAVGGERSTLLYAYIAPMIRNANKFVNIKKYKFRLPPSTSESSWRL